MSTEPAAAAITSSTRPPMKMPARGRNRALVDGRRRASGKCHRLATTHLYLHAAFHQSPQNLLPPPHTHQMQEAVNSASVQCLPITQERKVAQKKSNFEHRFQWGIMLPRSSDQRSRYRTKLWHEMRYNRPCSATHKLILTISSNMVAISSPLTAKAQKQLKCQMSTSTYCRMSIDPRLYNKQQKVTNSSNYVDTFLHGM